MAGVVSDKIAAGGAERGSGEAGTSERQILSQRVQSIKASGIRKFFDIAASKPNVISLGVGEPDFVTPERISQAGIASIQRGMTHYTSNYGTLELREAIAALIQSRYDVAYDPTSETLVTVGVSEAIDLALRSTIDPGDEVIIPDPGYVAYAADVVLSEGVVVPVPTSVADHFEPKAEAIASALTPRTKAILLGNPNNPTGAVIAAEELAKIARLAQQHDLVVISDEVYSRLVYGQEHASIVTQPGMRERTILVDGFSKAYAMTGWRIGYICAPAAIINGIIKAHQYMIMSAPTMSQAAALEALLHGEDDVLRMVAEYDGRRKLIVDGLNAIGLPCYEPHGAFYAFPSIARLGMSSDEFAQRLLDEEEVAVVSGGAFGEAGEGFVRCAYCVARDKIEEAIERMGRFVKKHA